MDTVRNLIQQIYILRDNNNILFKHIKRPDVLISGLEQLDELIGMRQLKETISEIVYTYLLDSHKGKITGVFHFCNHGEPGTGKTRSAKIIARIYYGLGVNENKRKVVEIDNWYNSFDELTKNFTSINRCFNNLKEKYPRRRGSTPRISSDDVAWRDMEISLSIANTNLGKTKNLVDDFLDRQDENKTTTVLGDDEKDYLIICGRNELVAKFSGQSAGLAYNFLLNNRGKTIIIEEAYSLYTGDKDIFGAESIVEINRFMEEFPGEISIGFNGYREMLTKSIFQIQPGLAGRIRYHYNMDDYNSDKLCRIFITQISKLAITLSSTINLDNFFKNNIIYFNSYGRDTLTLANICKQVYIQNSFIHISERLNEDPDYKLEFHIDSEIFNLAFKKYIESILEEN